MKACAPLRLKTLPLYPQASEVGCWTAPGDECLSPAVHAWRAPHLLRPSGCFFYLRINSLSWLIEDLPSMQEAQVPSPAPTRIKAQEAEAGGLLNRGHGHPGLC